MSLALQRLSLSCVLTLVACADAPSTTSPSDASVDRLFDTTPDVDITHKGAARFVVTHYDYAIDLTTRAVQARLTLRVEQAGDCLTVGFRHTEASDVRFDDMPARDVVVANNTLLACDGTSRGWAAGRTITLSVRSTEVEATWRPTQVGFSTRTSASGGRFTYLLSWVGECARHGPCDASPGTFATYRFVVTHPEGTQVLCPGTVTPNETQTTCVFEHRGGPTYSTFGVMAMSGGWTLSELGTASGVRLRLYDTTLSRVGATLDRERLRAFVSWMIMRFGAFPYGDELRFVVAPTYWAGFEHPGNIAIAETLVAGGRLEHTIRHEIVHQWAGDQTTLAAVKDFVWKEAMAEYLSFVFEDEVLGRSESTTTLNVWRSASGNAERWPIPDEDLPLVSFYGSAYGPGPMILFRQLEVIHSRRQVLDAIRVLLGRERALTIVDVQRALEQSTGASLDGYMRAWLRGVGAPAWPGASVERRTNTDGSVTLRVRLTTRDGVTRPCRFTVRLMGEGKAMLDVPVTVGFDGMQSTEVTVRPMFAVTGEVINPNFEALVWPMTSPDGRWIEHVPARGFDPFRAPGVQ